MSSGFKTFFWILAVLCILMVIMIPAGILLIYLIFNAEVRMTPHTLERKWMGKKTMQWNEITELKWLPTPGALQKAMRPLRVVAKNPTRIVKAGIPVGVFERSPEIIAEMQKRSGKTIAA
jgi:hypothetical protein